MKPLCDLPAVADAPKDVWDCQDSFARAIDDKLSLFKSENADGSTQDKGDLLTQAVQGRSYHPRVKKMAWEDAVMKARNKVKDLEKFKVDSEQWAESLDVEQQKKQFETLCKAFDDCLEKLDYYRVSVSQLEHDEGYKQQQEKDHFKNLKDRVYGQLWKQGLPKGPSKVIYSELHN